MYVSITNFQTPNGNMSLQTITAHPPQLPIENLKFNHKFYHVNNFFNQTKSYLPFSSSYSPRRSPSQIVSNIRLRHVAAGDRRNRLITGCASPIAGTVGENVEVEESASLVEVVEQDGSDINKTGGREEFANESIWNKMVEIVKFSGPATGVWICGPLMSVIDTVVIGQGSSIELAALGPGTVLCDNMSYVFMFLSFATSNMVATSLAKLDKDEAQHQISILLFIALVGGVGMLFFTMFLGPWLLTAFTGGKNVHILPAANTYVQIRGLAWPAVLVGWVTQSASLGMKNSWGPLKALAVASAVNAIGDVVLCSFLGYGIAGAAWATVASQVIAGFMMIEALNKKGYNAYAVSVPSSSEVLQIFKLAAPAFVTMTSKMAFYSLIVYFATSMGTSTIAAHQVMIQIYLMCAVCGEPLSQTAQSFMPELMYGVNRNLGKARTLLKSLLIIGALTGLVLGSIATSVPLIFPKLFTPDPEVIGEMHKVLVPYLSALCITPCVHSLEGTLLAGRDLKFISLSMSGCFIFGGLVLLFVSTNGYGLPGCWFTLVGFQWSRFFIAIRRLISQDGILYSENTIQQLEMLKATA